MKKINSGGFGILALAMILVLIGLLVFAGSRINKKSEPKASTSSTISDSTEQVKEITSPKELDTTTKDIDSVNLDTELDTSELDSDISSVL